MPIRLWSETGNLVWQANADAWGNCSPETPNGRVHQPIRLPGQFEDELTGLYHNRFRDYDPETGRYLTPDPIGIKGGLNSYRYTPNPIDYIDPMGLDYGMVVTPENTYFCPEEAPVPDDVPDNMELSALDWGVGGAEMVGTGLWNGAVDAVAGLSGLATSAVAGVDSGASVIETVQKAGLQPQTEAAQAMGEAVAPVFEQYEAGKEALGEVGMGQGSPELATALYTAPDAAMAALGGFIGRGVKRGLNRRKQSGGNDAGQDGPNFQKKNSNYRSPEDFDHKSANHRKAAAGEHNAHALMKEKGFTPMGKTDGTYRPGENGLDGVYQNPSPPPDYAITEAKYNKARLGNTKDGRQGSDDWVLGNNRLEKSGLSRKEAKRIEKGLEDGKVDKYLIRSNTDGSMKAQKLDKDGYVDGTPDGF